MTFILKNPLENNYASKANCSTCGCSPCCCPDKSPAKMCNPVHWVVAAYKGGKFVVEKTAEKVGDWNYKRKQSNRYKIRQERKNNRKRKKSKSGWSNSRTLPSPDNTKL